MTKTWLFGKKAVYGKGKNMANHKSSKKRIRQIARRRQINKSARNEMSTLEKNLRKMVQEKAQNQAVAQLKVLQAKMDRSVRKGLQSQNKVRRKKAQLALLVQSISS